MNEVGLSMRLKGGYERLYLMEVGGVIYVWINITESMSSKFKGVTLGIGIET